MSSITVCSNLHYEFKSLRALIDLYQTLGETLIRATGKSVMTEAEMEWNWALHHRESADVLPSG